MIVHGMFDATLPYDGGVVTGPCGPTETKSIDDTVDFWLDANGCSPIPSRFIGSNYTRDAYACPKNDDVVLISITNGEHEWPGPNNSGFEASKAIWSFFDQHSL